MPTDGDVALVSATRGARSAALLERSRGGRLPMTGKASALKSQRRRPCSCSSAPPVSVKGVTRDSRA